MQIYADKLLIAYGRNRKDRGLWIEFKNYDFLSVVEIRKFSIIDCNDSCKPITILGTFEMSNLGDSMA